MYDDEMFDNIYCVTLSVTAHNCIVNVMYKDGKIYVYDINDTPDYIRDWYECNAYKNYKR